MAQKADHVAALMESRVIAIMRADSSSQLVDAARALCEGGVRFVEVTMTTPGALKVIEGVIAALGEDVVMGAGTVLDAESARSAIAAGAQFIVTPTFSPDVVTTCRDGSVMVVPGAFTPTEILAAWECGADFVKVFPSSAGGPGYIKAVRAPLPQVRMVAVGGVRLDNVAEFIAAGAEAVGVGGNLMQKDLLQKRNFAGLASLARQYVDAACGNV